jgi:hypothetical protein
VSPVSKHDAFPRGFVRLTPEALKVINDLVVQVVVDLGLEDGTKLRVDTTVVQTDNLSRLDQRGIDRYIPLRAIRKLSRDFNNIKVRSFILNGAPFRTHLRTLGREGAFREHIAVQDKYAFGFGRLFGSPGKGKWSGRSGQSLCAGYWTAQRN